MKEVIKKLKFKGTGVVVNAPADLEAEFKKNGFKTSFDKNEKSKNALVFINSNKEYLGFLNKDLKNIAPDSVLWFAYPKGTSKIKTDINRDTLRLTGAEYGITAVSLISINDTWSALRLRPIDKLRK